jgi:hypothetical protein
MVACEYWTNQNLVLFSFQCGDLLYLPAIQRCNTTISRRIASYRTPAGLQHGANR